MTRTSEILKEEISNCESKYSGQYEDLIRNYPVLTNGEEKLLFYLYHKTGDDSYKDVITKCYLRYVFDTCNNKTSYREDLISEGTILLLNSIEKYDYRTAKTSLRIQLINDLARLYTKLTNINEQALNTSDFECSLRDYEEEYDEEEQEQEPRKEKLIIEISERTNIIKKDYLLGFEASFNILSNILGYTGKTTYKKSKVLGRKYKPTDLEY